MKIILSNRGIKYKFDNSEYVNTMNSMDKPITLKICSTLKHCEINEKITLINYTSTKYLDTYLKKIINEIRVKSTAVVFTSMIDKMFNIFHLTTNVKILMIHGFKTLTKIPTNLPCSIKVLHICDAAITKIENIPYQVIELGLAGNKIKTIENIPTTVKMLILGGNNIKEIKQNISFVNMLEINSGKRKKKLLRNYISDKLIFYKSSTLCDRAKRIKSSTTFKTIWDTYSHMLKD